MASKAELLDKASRLAFEYERDYGGCSQCVLAAIKNSLGTVSDEVFQAATGLAGGVGLQGKACGALTGGAMALGCFYGRDLEHFNDAEGRRFVTLRMVEKLVNKFVAEYGSADCFDIQTKLMGRHFPLALPGMRDLFLEAGGHDDKCTMVCAKAAEWIVDILDEEGLLEQQG